MSALTEALEFVGDWVQQYMPNHPAAMNRGLSRDAIEAKAKELPFYLPEEIYELYQWKNCGVNPFLPHPDAWDLATFFSLEEAISIAQDWKGSFHLFPLFMVEDGGYFFVGTQEKCQTAPIYCNDILEEVVEREPKYPSLTSMVQELVEELRSRS